MPDVRNACAASQQHVRALVEAQPALLPVDGLRKSPVDRRGGLRGSKVVSDTPENQVLLLLQHHVSDQLRCSKQPRLLRRARPILPPSALTATALLQPLAQPTALRHPGSRCDIDSHPDCRPFLILIVAPQVSVAGTSRLPAPVGCGHCSSMSRAHALTLLRRVRWKPPARHGRGCPQLSYHTPVGSAPTVRSFSSTLTVPTDFLASKLDDRSVHCPIGHQLAARLRAILRGNVGGLTIVDWEWSISGLHSWTSAIF